MNFLEQLAAEWYEYNGYFVRTNIKFGRRERGGYVGEMDVVGYKPEMHEFIHVEASTDANSLSKRKSGFEKKFTNARKYYMEIFPFKKINIKPKQIALVGFGASHDINSYLWKSSAPSNSVWGDIKIEVIHIPEFLKTINENLKNKDPQKNAVPESYPLLRAMQYAIFYNNN